MKRLIIYLMIFGLSACLTQSALAEPIGTAFTYNGRLIDANNAAEGQYDFQFKLFNASSDGNQISGDINKEDVNVVDGYFIVQLDFGSEAFDGQARWLEMGVHPGDSVGSFTLLSPRQEITPTPYAIQSKGTIGTLQLVRDFVVAAGETVSAGDVVVFINETVRSGSLDTDFDSESLFNSADTDNISAAALSETKFLVAYRDMGNSGYGTAKVGEISGGSISFGSTAVFNSAATADISTVALSETNVFIAYMDVGNGRYGTAVAGTVSGNSVSFGSEYTFNLAETYDVSATNLSSSKVVVAYRDVGNSNYGTAVAGQVSGIVVGFGSEYIFNSGGTYYVSAAGLSDSNVVITYEDTSNSNYGTGVVGNVSGNAISFGSEYAFNKANTLYNSAVRLSDTEVLIAYADGETTSWYGTAVVGTLLGNSLRYGPEYIFYRAPAFDISVAVLSDTRFVFAYKGSGFADYYGATKVGKVLGTAIEYSSETIFNNASSSGISASALSATMFIVSYEDVGNSSYGTAIAGTAPSFVAGIADSSASGGETVPVIMDGISSHHSGLVSGNSYYAQPDGSISSKWTYTKVGNAISSTELLLDIDR